MSGAVKTVGDYELLEPLGSGAAGAAYRGKHCETGEQVAIKLMHERLAGEPDIQNRFVREVSVLEKLDHPNVVQYKDCGLDDGRLFLAMEWVEFGSLAEVLERRGKLPWREAVEVTIQICAGLEHAHEKDIIHRDLKPANLFLSADGLVKIGDFGLARDGAMHRLTLSGNTVGTCRYMAPEQVRGEEVLTGATDLYSVGCLLFRMLTGRVPYDGATIMEIFEHHLYTDVPDLNLPRDDRPEELDHLVALLLIKNPAGRPGKANEVREALQAILHGDGMSGEFTSVAPSPQAEGVSEELVEELSAEQAAPPPNLSERLVHGRTEMDAPKANPKVIVVVLGLLALVGLIAFIASR